MQFSELDNCFIQTRQETVNLAIVDYRFIQTRQEAVNLAIVDYRFIQTRQEAKSFLGNRRLFS